MNMVTYSDPPTPVEIVRAKARRRRWMLMGIVAALLLAVRPARMEEANRLLLQQPEQS